MAGMFACRGSNGAADSGSSKIDYGPKVYVPHMVITVLEQKGGHWLSPSRMLKYQVVLLEQDDVELKTTAIVNPAMFLSTENPTEKLEHDCLLTIEQVYSSRPDLKDEPLKDPDLELFTDGSSFVQEGRRMAGYAVVTTDKVLESGTLPANTSAQKAELVALKQALRMAEGKREDKTLETGIPTEVENAVTPLVWAGEVPGKAKNAELVKIELKAGMKPKNSPPEHLEWDDSTRNAFKQLKRTLMKAPALGLPDLTKTFELFVHERQAIALGVLSQMLGGNRHAVAYFSKQLDNISKGWPGCLRAVAATVLLIQEAWKLTLGQKMTGFVPHMVLTVLDQKGGHWLSPSRMLKYQVALLEQDDAVLKSTAVVNLAVFLSSRQLEEEEPTHDCLQTIEEVYSSRPDLKDTSLENPDWELYTDGSSFVKKGIRMSGYAVTTVDTVVEAKALQPKTSAQKAELIALTRALELSEGKRVNIWTDSKYAFGVLHAHGAIWKERGLLSSQGTGIRHAEQILKLLESVQKPREVAIMHCKAHQTGRTPQERGNQLADVTACKVAEKGKGILAIIPEKKIELGEFPNYDSWDKNLIETLKTEIQENGWAVTPTGQVILTPILMHEIVKKEHNSVHWGTENLVKHLQKSVVSLIW
ncbi:protein NYNRIN-like [Grus japonensis]|uniref:Protein NYNRIN-like n=1 Tax=Grus japonensis TaxID=30415 RepID=A0ABC9YD75_GRUJA